MVQDYYKMPFQTYRVSSSVDSNNFEIETLVINESDYGYIEPLSGNERYFNDKKEAYTTHRLFSPVIDIIESDEIHIAGSTYDVDLIQNFNNHHLEVILILRK